MKKIFHKLAHVFCINDADELEDYWGIGDSGYKCKECEKID